VRSCVLDLVECFKGTLGQRTEETVAAQLADYAIFHQFKAVRGPHGCLRNDYLTCYHCPPEVPTRALRRQFGTRAGPLAAAAQWQVGWQSRSARLPFGGAQRRRKITSFTWCIP